MEKKTFIKTINAIKKQMDYDLKFSKFLSNAFPDAHEATLLPKNNHLQNALIELLQIEFNDNHAHSWIEYFLWELDFGKENYRLKAYDKDKKEIPLKTPSDLYDLLVSGREKI